MYVDYLLHLTGRDLERRYFTTNGDNDVKLTDSSTSVANKGITVGLEIRRSLCPSLILPLPRRIRRTAYEHSLLFQAIRRQRRAERDSLSRWEETNP